ncbi:Nn.00g020360.m01.CDS01 [Neocucurbitaria sp. VM-36]
MIWYLLYPLRGTTEPPRLSTSHPIRRAFQAHGTATARHWLLSIVLTITISVLLCYQAVFQTESSAAAGLRNLPKHVWTSTTEIGGERPADVVVRQVWVHGDYMNAIDLRVLREATYVQDALIGSGFDREETAQSNQLELSRNTRECVVPGADQKWGWHSPLMYWDCSLSALEEDRDLLATINAHARGRSALNITLRPSTVFAGKAFSNTKLRAADALVITMFDQTNSNLGEVWDSRSRQLAAELPSDWAIFPNDGHVTRNRLYEFRFSPMTLTSFTLCTYLGIDLARIPRPWFPGVVFCFGLGNIFRLINVVLETPPEMPPHQRIGNALGEVGHLSLAIAFQNLALLYLCSRLVTPWVADFCVFAAVTLVFDLVFHLTFFVAVLSVDVQRMELSDSLERTGLNPAKKKNRQERQAWLSALRQGTLPLSTRFAGTVAIFSIILAINWHFFDSNDKQLSFNTLRQRFLSRRHKRSNDSTWGSPPINQARTPADWLRIQDHNTARELFGFIKPGAHSFVARIYDPILVVSKGAHGRDRPQPPTSLLDGLRRFAQGHAFPAALIAVFLIAGVTLLMNYLLWTGLPDDSDETEDKETIFSVKTLPNLQKLDVVRLASCSKGHLATISLDRSTTIWLHDRRGYLHTTLQTATMKPKLWPIYASAMDEGGSLLALCADSGQIGLWSTAASRFLMFPKVDIRGQVPVLFTFANLTTRTDTEKICLMIVSPDGYLTELEARTGIHHTKCISSNLIVCATLYTCAKGDNCLVFVTKPGEVHILSLSENGNSTSEVVAGLDPGPPPGSNPAKIQCIQGVPSLGLIFALRNEEAEVFDFTSRALIHSFQIGHIKPHSFRVMHSARRLCACGAPTVHSLSVAYAEQDTDHMIMQTFTLDDTATSQICLGKAPDREKQKCSGLDRTKESVHYVEPAGVWESTSALSVVGIRKCVHSSTLSSATSDDDDHTADPIPLVSDLKQRARKQRAPNGLFRSLDSAFGSRSQTSTTTCDADTWEAWTLSSTGEFHSRPLAPDDPEDNADACLEGDLFVAAPGPISRLGKRSIAVGFGNTAKIITLGKESFDGLTNMEDGTLDIGLGSYKWRARKGNGRKIQ